MWGTHDILLQQKEEKIGRNAAQAERDRQQRTPRKKCHIVAPSNPRQPHPAEQSSVLGRGRVQ